MVSDEGARNCHLFESEDEAAAVVRDLKKELGLETGITCSAAIDAYELALKAKGNKSGSIEDTVYRLKRILGQEWMTRALRLLSVKEAERLYSKLTFELKADSHRNMLAETKTWARWCVAQKIIRVSAFENVKGTGRRSKGKEQLRNDEGRRLLDECLRNGRPGAIALALALMTGMRSSEIRSRVARDLDDGGTSLVIPFGKTRSAKRVLEVPADLQKPLRDLAEGKEATQLLFGERGETWLRKWAKSICRAAGVPYVCPHGLRGTFTTVQLRTLQRPDLTAAAVGHASTKMTLGTYAAPGTEQELAQERKLRIVEGGRR